MKNLFVVSALVLTLAVGVTAQQLEPNDPGGSLTSGGANPVPGANFIRNVTGNMNMEVGGTANAGYALILGDLAAASIPIGDGQFFDLNPGNAFLIGNGLGGGGGAIPPNFFILNGAGTNALNYPCNSSMNGQTFAFQAIVFDAAALFQINFTAACAFDVTSAVIVTSDDLVTAFAPPSGIGYTLYGATVGVCNVDTNGWVNFANATPFSDFSESADDFVNGNPGSAAGAGPVFAPLWDDIDMGNGNPGQQLVIDEPTPGMTVLQWQNADYFPATALGSFTVTIDTTGGTFVSSIDMTGYTNPAPPSEGIVGMSDGLTAAAVAQSHDLLLAGVVNPFGPTNPAETVFQAFNGAYGATGVAALPAEPIDTPMAPIINFIDASGLGGIAYF